MAAPLTLGTEFSVTYTLHNAVLDERVVNKHFMWGTWGPATNTGQRGGVDCDPDTTEIGKGEDLSKVVFCPVDDEIDFERHDGSKGDRSVTFAITIAGNTPLAG